MFYVNVIFRISHFFDKIKLYPIAKIFWLINKILFSVEINPKAKIDGGFVIMHGFGLVIGPFVKIGHNVTVYQGVILGGSMGKTKIHNGVTLKQPLVEDDVVISPYSLVLGPIVLNKNCFIGAGSIVIKDVPENAIVAGNPAKIIRIKEQL
jgi:serine O-acetyltransferase